MRGGGLARFVRGWEGWDQLGGWDSVGRALFFLGGGDPWEKKACSRKGGQGGGTARKRIGARAHLCRLLHASQSMRTADGRGSDGRVFRCWAGGEEKRACRLQARLLARRGTRRPARECRSIRGSIGLRV